MLWQKCQIRDERRIRLYRLVLSCDSGLGRPRPETSQTFSAVGIILWVIGQLIAEVVAGPRPETEHCRTASVSAAPPSFSGSSGFAPGLAHRRPRQTSQARAIPGDTSESESYDFPNTGTNSEWH
jgi:hypothetical protein